MIRRIILLLVACMAAKIPAQDVSHHGPLTRRYKEGERLTYQMKASNENWRYEIQAAGIVKKDSSGKYLEEYAWSHLISNGATTTLSSTSAQFRQILSLDPDVNPSIPNLSVVSPSLIGPITDLLTFYADLWLTTRDDQLTHSGDHVYRKHGTPASWADGAFIVLGEDSIDFDITLTSLDESARAATLLIRHVPPEQPQVRLPAAWMREPVAATPNNWVQVMKKDGAFVAAVGKETFAVQLKVSTEDGKILSGAIENVVDARERDCTDAAFTNCGNPRPHHILRKVEIALDR
jgi:hypothetical protein